MLCTIKSRISDSRLFSIGTLNLKLINKDLEHSILYGHSLGYIELRDKRESVSDAGFVSYGFGRFGSFHSRYGWRHNKAKVKHQPMKTSGSVSHKEEQATYKRRKTEATKKSSHSPFSTWWKPEDKPVVG